MFIIFFFFFIFFLKKVALRHLCKFTGVRIRSNWRRWTERLAAGEEEWEIMETQRQTDEGEVNLLWAKRATRQLQRWWWRMGQISCWQPCSHERETTGDLLCCHSPCLSMPTLVLGGEREMVRYSLYVANSPRKVLAAQKGLFWILALASCEKKKTRFLILIIRPIVN